MKKLLFTCLLSGMLLTVIKAQYGVDRTGYEGDYFSLEGAIELFRESRSINNFERRLNNEDSWVNNLDLNYDGDIDYIRVEHRNQGDFHAIILQAILGRRDVQDVAVIEIERTGRRSAVLQIIGDPDLYGEEVIAEPYNSAGYSSRGDYDFNRGYVNVFHWRAVQRMFDRSYVVYVSPYRWNYYPTYWSPWRQHVWNVYHPRRVRYYNRCHIVYVHRVIHVHNFYRPFRVYSHHVAQRANKHRRTYGTTIVHRSHGKKDNTYRAPVRNLKSSKVASRNTLGSRTTSSNGRKTTASPRTNTRASTNVQRRDVKTRSSANSQQVRPRGSNKVKTKKSDKISIRSDRNRTGSVSSPTARKEQSRTHKQAKTRSTHKSQSAKSGQNRTVKSQTQSRSQSQTRKAPVQKQKRAQTKTTPRKTQQRTAPSRKQSSQTRSSSTRNSNSRRSAPARKSTAPKRSATSGKSSGKKSVRKGRG